MFNGLVQLARYKHAMEGQMGEEEFTQLLLTKQVSFGQIIGCTTKQR
jgi:hypothetical protein